jgi:hypothetical protein
MENHPHNSPQTESPETEDESLSVISRTKEIGNRDLQADPLSQQELNHMLKDGDRGDKYKTHIHNIVVTGMYVLGFALILLVLVRAWHMGAPENLKWLNPDQCHEIERVIFSSVIVTLAGRYFKRYKIFGE